jgi:hypothetical protein
MVQDNNFHNSYSSTNIIIIFKSDNIIQTGKKLSSETFFGGKI